MKLHTDNNSAMNSVTAYDTGFVEINKIRFEHAIAFGPLGEIIRWPAQHPLDISFELLLQATRLSLSTPNPLAFLEEDEYSPPSIEGDKPEVLLIGTGSTQTMLPHAVTHQLLRFGVGVEVMSTPAACRTYNILMGEGRKVVVALIPPSL